MPANICGAGKMISNRLFLFNQWIVQPIDQIINHNKIAKLRKKLCKGFTAICAHIKAGIQLPQINSKGGNISFIAFINAHIVRFVNESYIHRGFLCCFFTASFFSGFSVLGSRFSTYVKISHDFTNAFGVFCSPIPITKIPSSLIRFASPV